MPRASSLADVAKEQAAALGWTARSHLATPKQAEAFVERYGVVLRYTAPPAVKIASLRLAAGPATSDAAVATSIRLTNHVLSCACGLEVNVIGTRLTIVHRSLVPALYRLVRRARAPDDRDGLSLAARTACALIEAKREISAGDLRTHLGIRATPRRDPAYEALAELQRHLLVDRGPFVVPKTGIPYLSREGYPYHFLHEAHADLVRSARRLTREAATDAWLAGYVRGIRIVAPKTMASLFRQFLSAAEIAASVERLAAAGAVAAHAIGRQPFIVSKRPPTSANGA